MSDALLWSIEEAARQLGGISTRTVERLIQSGELPIIYVRRRRMLEAEVVRRWIAIQNERARARVEGTPCQEKTVMVSTSNRGRRTGTPVIPMRTENAAAAVLERIARLKQKSS